MRLTEFWERMDATFGRAYARRVAPDQLLAELGGRTIDEALRQGDQVLSVWRAVCAAYPERVPPKLRR